MPADDVDFAHTGFQAIRKIRPAQAASDYIRNARLPTTTSTATEQLPMTTRHEPAVAAERHSRTNARTINSCVLLMKNEAPLKPIDETRVSGGLKVVSSRSLTPE
jgi:hypothetical protein